MSAKRKSKPAPPPPAAASSAPMIVYTLAALISLAGLTDGIYLTVQAMTGETLTCGGSPDCFRVLGSAYARVAGMPVAGFGAVAYFCAFGSAVFAASGSRRAGQLFSCVVAAMFLATLWFLFVQAFLLHAFCRYCLFSAAATFLLAGLAVFVSGPSRRSAVLPVIGESARDRQRR